MKLLKFLFLLFFFIAALIAYAPKKSLYYLAEQELARYKTIIANERVEEGLFSLAVEHADIQIEGIRAAKIIELRLQTYLLHNTLQARRIRLSGMAKNFLPTKVDRLDVRYDLFDPTNVHFEAAGEFGMARGDYSLTSHALNVTLQPSKLMHRRYRNILRQMRKEKNGEYSYERHL